jgi:uncharacterized membrane protein YkvA (DUF1232 family)
MNSTYEPSSLAFLRRISRPRRSAGDTIESIPEYVEHRAALLTSEFLDRFLRELPLLRIHFAGIVSPRFPHLAAQLKLLSELFEDSAHGFFLSVSLATRKETALALRYTANNTDIIADHVPEIGYADDSLIVRTVLKRHRDVFRDYCRLRKIRWSEITLAP